MAFKGGDALAYSKKYGRKPGKIESFTSKLLFISFMFVVRVILFMHPIAIVLGLGFDVDVNTCWILSIVSTIIFYIKRAKK